MEPGTDLTGDGNVKLGQTVGVAAREGQLEQLKKLITDGHPVDVMDNRGWRPTHEAVAGNHIQCLEVLLAQEKTDVSWVTFEGTPALLLAAEKGNRQVVELLLQHGADPNQRDSFGHSPLLAAVKSADLICVEKLLEHGANVNAQNFNGTSALHQAATVGHADICRCLVKHGAHLDIKEEYQITPVFTAAQFGHLECLKIMLEEAEAKSQKHVVNLSAEDGATPLYLAAQDGHVDCVRCLLKYGADANRTTIDPFKALPLHAALEFSHMECLKALFPETDFHVLYDCDANLFELSMAHQFPECTKCLLYYGVDPNYRHQLPREDHFRPRVFQLCESKVKFDQNVTPLTWLALHKGDLCHADALLQAGASVNASTQTEEEISPLLAALNKRSLNLAEILIKHGSDVNIYHPAIHGNLTLFMCVNFSQGLILMLKCGAEVDSLLKFHTHCRHNGDQGRNDTNATTSTDCSDESGTRSGTKLTLYDIFTCCGEYICSDRAKKKIYQLLSLFLHFCASVKLDPMLKLQTEASLWLRLQPTTQDNTLQHEWMSLLEITGSPRSLSHLCRLVIRRQLRPHQLMEAEHLSGLPLPSPLMDYVMYKDIEQSVHD